METWASILTIKCCIFLFLTKKACVCLYMTETGRRGRKGKRERNHVSVYGQAKLW